MVILLFSSLGVVLVNDRPRCLNSASTSSSLSSRSVDVVTPVGWAGRRWFVVVVGGGGSGGSGNVALSGGGVWVVMF